MNNYVIDASVAGKWVISEPQQAEAKRYRNSDFSLLVPDIFLLECASAIQKKVWRDEISQKEGWSAYETLQDYDRFTSFSVYDLIPEAYELANQYWHPIYDCLYLALALQEDAQVVTADRKFYDQIQKTPLAHLIVWVEDPPEVLA